jgi:nucleotide-binding universal stress UspA family protein
MIHSEETNMRILIGVDGSHPADVACEFVERRTWPLGTRVSLIGVVAPLVDVVGIVPSSDGTNASDHLALGLILDERADALRRHGLTVETSVEFGHAADVLIDRATESFADLIVVGSRGLGPVARIVLGSVSTHLADHARCPVLVVRSPEATRMLLATDGTRSSLGIPRVLAAWGNAFRGLPVEVLSVAPRNAFITPWAGGADEEVATQPAELSLHEGIAREVADEMMELGWHAAAVARAGDPARQIVSTGVEWRADLIVTGSRGLGTLRRMVEGSVAHDVLLHARSSVLVVRGLVPAQIPEAASVLSGLAPA